MVINIFYIIAILGLTFIISGTLMLSRKKIQRKKIYAFLITGGICLLIYSIYIMDFIFTALQVFYTLVVIYDIIKLKSSGKRK